MAICSLFFRFARQNAKSNLGETYVLTNFSKEILGFYTISTASLDYDAYTKNKGMPIYVIHRALWFCSFEHFS